MNAEIVSVGTELLLGTTVDTNAAFMGEILAECGLACTHRQTVGDNLERLTAALRLALSRADVVITIGGLGPTQDDLTRDGIAAALENPLVHDSQVEASIRATFEARGLRWVDSNARQAMRPECGEIIANAHGTAPGLVCRKGGKVVLALPGPPREFNPMASGGVKGILASLSGGQVIHSRILRVCGLGESRVEELTLDLMAGSNPSLAPYAKTMEVHLRLTAAAGSVEEAERLIEPLEKQVRERLGWHVYGLNEISLEAAVVHRMAEKGETLSVAESCTGGLLGARLTSVPGSSRVFTGGLIAYSKAIKHSELEVSPEVLREHTAVSEPVAIEMCLGSAKKFGSDWALSITGVAGPGPDDDGNPEGLVFIGLKGPESEMVARHQLGKGRENIRTRAAQLALTLLWQKLQ